MLILHIEYMDNQEGHHYDIQNYTTNGYNNDLEEEKKFLREH